MIFPIIPSPPRILLSPNNLLSLLPIDLPYNFHLLLLRHALLHKHVQILNKDLNIFHHRHLLLHGPLKCIYSLNITQGGMNTCVYFHCVIITKVWYSCVFKFISKMDEYLLLEQAKIQHDADDNQLIRKLVNNYRDLQIKLTSTQQENDEFSAEIKILRQQNQSLTFEIKSMKESQKNEEGQNNQANTFASTAKDPFGHSTYMNTPVGLNRTFDQSTFTQLTKRRVINGFVGQLTHELEQSQILLMKERRMQEESRRTLLLCNEEVSTMKIAMKELDNRVLSLTLQNQKLYRQLQASNSHRNKLEEKLQLNTIKTKHEHTSLQLNFEEYQAEMNKMDAIYSNIELQLTSLT